MTLPGAIQAIVCLGSTVYAYNLYFKRWDNVIVPALLGIALFAIGLLIEVYGSYGSATKDSVHDILTFNPKHFHQGAVTSALGIGIFFGSLTAWFVSLIKKII